MVGLYVIPHGKVDAQHEKFDWRPPDEFGVVKGM